MESCGGWPRGKLLLCHWANIISSASAPLRAALKWTRGRTKADESCALCFYSCPYQKLGLCCAPWTPGPWEYCIHKLPWWSYNRGTMASGEHYHDAQSVHRFCRELQSSKTPAKPLTPGAKGKTCVPWFPKILCHAPFKPPVLSLVLIYPFVSWIGCEVGRKDPESLWICLS